MDFRTRFDFASQVLNVQISFQLCDPGRCENPGYTMAPNTPTLICGEWLKEQSCEMWDSALHAPGLWPCSSWSFEFGPGSVP